MLRSLADHPIICWPGRMIGAIIDVHVDLVDLISDEAAINQSINL